MILKIVLVLIFIYLTRIFIKYLANGLYLYKIPGLSGIPFVGNVHQFGSNSKDFMKFLLESWEKAKFGTFRYSVGSKTFVMFTEPQTIKYLLLEKCTTETVKSEAFHRTKNLLEIEPQDKKSKVGKEIFLSALNDNSMEKYLSIFNASSKAFVKNLKKSLDVQQNSLELSFQTFCEYFIGVEPDEIKTEKIIRDLLRLEEIHRQRSTSIFHSSDILHEISPLYKEEQKFVDEIHEFCEDVVKTKKFSMANHLDEFFNQGVDNRKKYCHSILDGFLYYKSSKGLPLRTETLKEEILNAMLYGVGPMSSAISFALFNLALNPEIQEKVFQEQQELLKKDQDPSLSDLLAMKYLEKVVKESLRLFSPIPFTARTLVNDIKTPDGYFIPSGTNVVANFMALGRNPKCHKNPTKFDPETHISEESYQTLLFGLGSKGCIGQKLAMAFIKSVLSKVIRAYHVTPSDAQKELQLEAGSFLRCRNGINLIFGDREQR